jgi:hypothetical protein
VATLPTCCAPACPRCRCLKRQRSRCSPGRRRLWTAHDALARVTRLLDGLPDGSKLTEFLPRIPADAPSRAPRCRAALASTLIASIELARDGALGLEQQADWTPIHATRRANGDAVADDPVSTD